MKRLLFGMLLLCPSLASAQSLDLRGFGGVMMNSGTYQSNYLSKASGLNAVGGIGASYRSGHFEYGLNLSYRRYSFQKRLVFADEFDPAVGMLPGKSPRIVTIREPALAVAPVFNYHFGGGKLDWYAGLSPAYVRFTSVAPTDKRFELSNGFNGFSIDAQLGCSYEVIPRLRCYAELSSGSVWMPRFMAEKMRFYNAAFSLGAQFRIGERSQRPSAAATE